MALYVNELCICHILETQGSWCIVGFVFPKQLYGTGHIFYFERCGNIN